jgi:transposase-like protein
MGRKPRVDRSPEEKWQIVQEGIKSGNVSETCRRHGIAPNLFYRWKDEAEQGAKAALGGRSAAVAETEKDHRIRQLERTGLRISSSRCETRDQRRDDPLHPRSEAWRNFLHIPERRRGRACLRGWQILLLLTEDSFRILLERFPALLATRWLPQRDRFHVPRLRSLLRAHLVRRTLLAAKTTSRQSLNASRSCLRSAIAAAE